MSKYTIKQSHYFTYVQTKEYSHSIPLLFPFIGQAIVFIFPKFSEKANTETKENASPVLFNITNASTLAITYLSVGLTYEDSYMQSILEHDVMEVNEETPFNPGETLSITEDLLYLSKTRAEPEIFIGDLSPPISVKTLGSMNIMRVNCIKISNDICIIDPPIGATALGLHAIDITT